MTAAQTFRCTFELNDFDALNALRPVVVPLINMGKVESPYATFCHDLTGWTFPLLDKCELTPLSSDLVILKLI